jgi:hypothetical protein
MPREPAFDHYRLRQLLTDDPYATESELAKILGANRATVESVIRRNRAAWGLPDRRTKVRHRDFMPPEGAVDRDHYRGTIMRYLREVARDANGDRPGNDDSSTATSVRRQALAWRDRLLAAGEIVDLTRYGVPVIRRATAGELDDDGRPAAVAAWMLPGWRKESRPWRPVSRT